MKKTRTERLKKVSVILVGLVLSFMIGISASVTAFAAVNHADINNDSESKKGIFYTDYSNPNDLMKAAKELAEEISEEGMVLMRNANNVLPLAANSKLSVFGKSSVNPAYGGGGSGALSGVTPVSLYESLQNAGFKTNGVLEAFYKNNALSGTGRSDRTYVNETPKTAYKEYVTTSYSAYGDAAIVVLTRTGAEGSDLPRTGNIAQDEGALYLSVTQDEIDLIKHANDNFDRVIVIVNSSNTIELGAIKNDVDAILWVGNPGERGFNAVGCILNGQVNPSGKLSDMYVSDLKMDPTWANFGNNSQNAGVGYISKSGSTYTYKTNLYNALRKTGETVPAGTMITINNVSTNIGGMDVYESAGTYTEYEEGIYVGYRYFETRAYEMAAEGTQWYEDNVDYAFGTGLSYTTFAWNWASGAAPGISLTKKGTITFDVKVKNTGNVAGKDVVQLYYSAPYTVNGIEKSYVNLGGYVKTGLLKPGEEKVYSISMKVQDMASFDWNDVNGNGFKGYELEAGTYNFFLGEGSHCWTDPKLSTSAVLTVDASDANFKNAATAGSNGLTYTTDSVTGNEIKILFSNNDIYNSNLMQNENKLKRGSFKTAPTDKNIIQEKTLADFTLSQGGWDLIKKTTDLFSIDKDASNYYAFEGEQHAPWYVETAPIAWKQYAGTGSRPNPTYTFADAAGWSYDDAKWETLLNELSWKELKDLVYVAGFTNAQVDYIGKARAIDDDGPMQVKLDQSPIAGTSDDFTGTGWPCSLIVSSTWDVDIALRQGVMLGNECLYLGLSGWFAPAMNYHRNQYGGRIFEYYSSDAIHGGKIAAQVTKGVQSKGVYAFLKHFCLNNQDTGRGSISIVVNEQAMRELYMNTFEIAVEEGGAHGLMTYYSYVGGVSIMQNYAILTEFVRNQWGFQGVINHDYGPEAYNSSICSPALSRRVGNGLGGNGATYDRYADQDYYDADKNMVYFCLTATGTVTKDAVASPTHWWAMRESAKQLLWTTANSNNQKNKLALSQFKADNFTVKQGDAITASVGVNATTFGTNIISYEISSGKLPEGVVLNAFTGAITGTPTVSGIYSFSVKMRADFWIKKVEAFTINVTPVANLVSVTPAVTGAAYYATIDSTAYAGATNMSYTVTSGALPNGYILNAVTGEITGKATIPGKFEAIIQISGRISNRDKILSILVAFDVTGKTEDEAAIDELNGKLDNANGTIGGLQSDLDKANKNADDLKNALDAANTKINSIETDLGKANDKITALESQGCGSTINAGSAIVMALLVIGAALIILSVRKFRLNKNK